MAFIRLSVLVVLGAALSAACGGGGGGAASSTASRAAGTARTASSPAARSGTAPTAGAPSAFAWLRPGPPPPGWASVRLPGAGAAVMAYPASWHRIHSDPGTVSAVRLVSGSERIADYVNATPQQGEETLENWSKFRPAHNVEEGDSHIKLLASARDLRFRDGRGSCVIDRYRTPAATYQEIACLVRGPHRGNVIVGAALAARWDQAAPALERAVSAFLA